MKISNSMRWLMTRILLFLALITVVLGIFTLPADLVTGGGLLLLGVSGAVFMAWMFRQEQGKSRPHKRWGAGISVAASLGLGFFLLISGEKGSLIPIQAIDENETESFSPSLPSASSSSKLSTSNTSEFSPTLTVTSTVQMEPESVTLEPEFITVTSSIFMAPEEVTATATIYVPAPQQNIQTFESPAPPVPSVFESPPMETSPMATPQRQLEEPSLMEPEAAPSLE